MKNFHILKIFLQPTIIIVPIIAGLIAFPIIYYCLARQAGYGWWAKYGNWCHSTFWNAMDHRIHGGKIRFDKW